MTTNESAVSASWKRPWSLNEIISHSNNWSLAGDAGVCELLKRFSSDLLTEVTQVSYNLSELQIESRQLNVVMENVSNDLCMLANDQFIENLVEEVQDTGYGKSNQDLIQPSKEDKAAQTIPLVKQALHMGLQVLENQFEIIDVTRMGSVCHTENELDSQTVQSTSDFPVNEPIYQPKDPYENRHLPHLIGTIDFIEDDTLGIGYIDECEEPQAMSDDDSASITTGPGARQDLLTSSSDDDDTGEERSQVRPQAQQRHLHLLSGKGGAKSDESDDDMFDTKDKSKSEDLFSDDLDDDRSEDLFNQDFDNKQSKVSKTTDVVEEEERKPLSLTEQLNKQLKARLSIGAKPSEVLAEKSEEPSPSISKKSVEEDVQATVSRPSIWSDNEEEEDDDIFAAPSRNKSKGQISITKAHEAIIVKSRAEQKSQSRISSESTVAKTKVNTMKQALPLEEDSDSGDDIFGLSKAPKKEVPKLTVVPKTTAKIEPEPTDKDDDLFEKTGSKLKSPENGLRTSTTKATTMGRTENKEADKTKRPATLMNPFHFSSDDEEYDDLFKPMAAKKESVVVKKEVVDAKKETENTTKPLTAVNNVPAPAKRASLKDGPRLSDSSDSDSIFAPSSTKRSTAPPKNTAAPIDYKNKPDQLAQPTKVTESVAPDKTAEKSQPDTKIKDSQPIIVAEDSSDSDDLFKPKSSKAFIKKTESPSITRKNDSAVITKKTESPNVSRKVDSPIMGKKVMAGLDPLSVDVTKSITYDKRPSTNAKPPVDIDPLFPNDTRTSIEDLDTSGDIFDTVPISMNPNQGSSNNNNADNEVVDKPRASQRALPPGAVSMFGGLAQSNKTNSLLDEMTQGARFSKTAVRHGVSSDEEEDKGNYGREKPGVEEVSAPRTFQPLIMMSRGREDSPVEEKPISLDTPVQAVNQLNNLTKGRVKAGAKRRPVTKKTGVSNGDGVIVEAPVMDKTMKEDEEATTYKAPSPAPPMVVAVTTPIVTEPAVVVDTEDIFANLPPPEKKTKAKKKESSKARSSVKSPTEVDVAEIDDIFATTKKSSTKKKSTKIVAQDPLGAL